MGVLTNLLKLLKPSENDYYNQQTEQADNWQKVDDYAVLTNTDKNGIWGGEYGGKIQDPIPKELNKRYIDNINGKAFICIKAGDSSVVSNTTEYFTPCNVVDNLGKLQNLDKVNRLIRLPNGRGILFVTKSSASKNYIACGEYFKSITSAVISPYISIPAGSGSGSVNPSIPFFQSILGTNVLMWSMEYSSGGTWSIKYYSGLSEELTTSCQAIIYGDLK